MEKTGFLSLVKRDRFVAFEKLPEGGLVLVSRIGLAYTTMNDSSWDPFLFVECTHCFLVFIYAGGYLFREPIAGFVQFSLTWIIASRFGRVRRLSG